MPGFDITNNYIRARQHDPSGFEKGTLRTIRLTSGIKAIVGRKKGDKTTTIQSVLFDKKRFDEALAGAWLDKHGSKFSDAMSYEEQKASLFNYKPMDYINEVLGGMTDVQLERVAEGLKAMAGPADEEVDLEEDMKESSDAQGSTENQKIYSQFGDLV